jgi:hypothetical protein
MGSNRRRIERIETQLGKPESAGPLPSDAELAAVMEKVCAEAPPDADIDVLMSRLCTETGITEDGSGEQASALVRAALTCPRAKQAICEDLEKLLETPQKSLSPDNCPV